MLILRAHTTFIVFLSIRIDDTVRHEDEEVVLYGTSADLFHKWWSEKNKKEATNEQDISCDGIIFWEVVSYDTLPGTQDTDKKIMEGCHQPYFNYELYDE